MKYFTEDGNYRRTRIYTNLIRSRRIEPRTRMWYEIATADLKLVRYCYRIMRNNGIDSWRARYIIVDLLYAGRYTIRPAGYGERINA